MWLVAWKKRSGLSKVGVGMKLGETNTMNCRPLAKPTTVFQHQQPNELDYKRIERALVNRKRYRYVTPEVLKIENGYLITSPCCSHTIDPDGGEIDIAKLEYLEEQNYWRLFRKDHSTDQWVAYADYASLPPILAILKEDPSRSFWQ
jgi:hypothetical protein